MSLSLYGLPGAVNPHEAYDLVPFRNPDHFEVNKMSLQISIITPSLNRAQYIEDAIQSVLNQKCPSVQHIIVDGGSTDGTLEILDRYSHIDVVSEPDRGMYDALNKGLGLARGEIVGFLNTDDLYADNVFLLVLELLKNPKVQAVAGRAKILKPDFAGKQAVDLELFPPAPAQVIKESIVGSTIFNAWFFKKTLFSLVDGFDAGYKISGDADLILRLALKGFKYTVMNQIVYLYRQHEGSLTMQLDTKKLLKIWDDHLIFRSKFKNYPDMPRKTNAYWNELFANTCIMISAEYLREENHIQAALWNLKAFLYAPYHVFVFKMKRVRRTIHMNVRRIMVQMKRLLKSMFSRSQPYE